MNKKLKEGKTKLANFSGEGVGKKETLGLMTKKKRLLPTSFRLTESDIADLKAITKAVNDISNSKISETKIIQALIHIGKNISDEKLLKAVKETI